MNLISPVLSEKAKWDAPAAIADPRSKTFGGPLLISAADEHENLLWMNIRDGLSSEET